MEKKKHGQFYTIKSPFSHPVFREWMNNIQINNNTIFVEPFGGSNNIIEMISEEYNIDIKQWRSYDIAPEKVAKNRVPEIEIIENDSIKNPPSADVVITNPPYLAKNSATRMKMDIDFQSFGDLYELAIFKILKKSKYVAAIIPESFITRRILTDRLFAVVSITDNIFDDTDFPVCLAMWNEQKTNDYQIWSGKEFVGWNKQLNDTDWVNYKKTDYNIHYNVPAGKLGLQAVDNTKEESIEYKIGSKIDSSKIKVSSRAITRIDIKKHGNSVLKDENIILLVKLLNKKLDDYRKSTKDVFLTSFKGLRKDGKYRRRLDWKNSSVLIHLVIQENLEIFSERNDNLL